jgi:hypothetical protein
MSEITTWAILTDGRYIRVLINKTPGTSLLTLKADDSEALADLCFEVIRGVKPGASNGTQSKQHTNMQLLAMFLDEQMKSDLYQKLVFAAPSEKLEELHKAMSAPVESAFVGEIDEDLLPLSINDIENKLADLLLKAQE